MKKENEDSGVRRDQKSQVQIIYSTIFKLQVIYISSNIQILVITNKWYRAGEVQEIATNYLLNVIIP